MSFPLNSSKDNTSKNPLYAGFPRDYRDVKYAKDKQVARCGNAVPPPFAEALVRANLPELCQTKEIAA
ncbi:hypothetical protein R4R77_004671 [Citrobacter amalonaticus]|nr:hypothetical protein [Citrobacter amalonaticus]